MKVLLISMLLPVLACGQSDIETAIRGGQVLLTGLTALKLAKEDPYGKNISSICVKNKTDQKITFSLTGKDDEGEVVSRELVIVKGGKECFFNVPKGIYTYVVAFSDETIFKKGEYKLDSGETIVIRGED